MNSNMKAHAFLRSIVSVTIVSGTLASASESMPAPVVYRVSESVRPGGIVSLYGEYLSGDVQIRVAETGSILHPVQVDREGRFARVVMPTVEPGVYTLIPSNDGGTNWNGKPIRVNQADPRWLSDERGYAGMRMRLLGRNLDAAQYGGFLYGSLGSIRGDCSWRQGSVKFAWSAGIHISGAMRR